MCVMECFLTCSADKAADRLAEKKANAQKGETTVMIASSDFMDFLGGLSKKVLGMTEEREEHYSRW